MELPSKAVAVVWMVLVFLAAVAGAWILFQVESPAAGVDAIHGAPLPVPARSPLPTGEHTRTFDVDARVSAAGAVRLRETIVQDFGVVPRHGIERVIPLRDDAGVHRLSDLVVSTSAGTPDDVKVSPSSDRVTIRIGDPDTTVNGVHTYRLAYTLDPATLPTKAPNASQLRIDALTDWQQAVDRLTYTVTSPGAPLTVRCFQGPLHTKQPCDSARRTATGASFTGTDLRRAETFTVRLTWPRTVVAVAPRIPAVDRTDWIYAAALGLAVGILAWAYRRRFVVLLRRARGELWTTFGADSGPPQTDAYELTDDPAIEFVPPMGLRPGEMGVLTDTGATEVLTGTVVDVAARGALKITEQDGTWTLERTGRDVTLTDDEQDVLQKLLEGRDQVSLADRRAEMGGLAHSLGEDLTDDLEDRGLAARGATAASLSTRAHGARVLFLGLAAVVAGCFAHAMILISTGSSGGALAAQAIVAGVILVIGGLAIIGTAARNLTPLGFAALWRVRGFDKFFDGSEAMHARAAADAGLLRQYMGYAIVFGHVDEWVAAFEGVDTSDWFDTSGPLTAGILGFTAGSLWTAPTSSGSSGSGFGSFGGGGGGGIGGGGGGSW